MRKRKRTGVRKAPPKAPNTWLPRFTKSISHRPMTEWTYKPGTLFRFRHSPIRSTSTAEERRLIMLRFNPPETSRQARMTPRAIAKALNMRTSHVLKVISRERHRAQ